MDEYRALVLSAIVALIISISGIVFTFLTHSSAILMDALFNAAYCIVGFATLKVQKLLLKSESQEFPVGFVFYEPLINGIKGCLVFGIIIMAGADSVVLLIEGGKHIEAELALVYAVCSAVAAGGVAWALLRNEKDIDSPLIYTDTVNWIINTITSIGLAIAFGLTVALERSHPALTPYIDPVLVSVLVIVAIHTPFHLIKTSFRQLLNHAPPLAVIEEVEAHIDECVGSVPNTEYVLRVLKPGRTLLIGLMIILDPLASVDVTKIDQWRRGITAHLAACYPSCITDVNFTGDESWTTGHLYRRPTCETARRPLCEERRLLSGGLRSARSAPALPALTGSWGDGAGRGDLPHGP